MNETTKKDRVWFVEFQFTKEDKPWNHIYAIKAATRERANLFGWRCFNRDYPLYNGGVRANAS
jgi:hypothetical protein